MKLIFGTILFTVLCLAVQAQSVANLCPEITVIGPSRFTTAGDLMTFKASIGNGQAGKLGYDWTVTAGAIESGQGTATISVRTTKDMGESNVTATVKVTGLSAECSQNAWEIAGVAPPPIACYFSYTINRANIGNNLFLLDNFLSELTNYPELHGLVSIKLNERESRALKLSFINRVYNFLVMRKTPLSRITFAVKKGPVETEAEFWAVPVEMAKSMSDGSDLIINGAEYKQKINDIFKPNK
jgi:hypothetical protein